LRVATWNVNSIRVRLPHLLRWLKEASPDVVCLQETKVVDDLFPAQVLADAGYPHQLIHGQKTYNGVAILSKQPLEDASFGFMDGDPDPQARIVRATVNGLRIYGLYVPNGSSPDSDKFDYKLDWLERLTDEIAERNTPETPILVCGDMNIAREDADVHDPFAAVDELLFTEDEHEALDALLAPCEMVDTYRKKYPFKSEFSWWDYRGNGFRYNKGYRIDHIYVSPPVLKGVKDVQIWRDTRGWEQPSDHAPVMVELEPTW